MCRLHRFHYRYCFFFFFASDRPISAHFVSMRALRSYLFEVNSLINCILM